MEKEEKIYEEDVETLLQRYRNPPSEKPTFNKTINYQPLVKERTCSL